MPNLMQIINISEVTSRKTKWPPFFGVSLLCKLRVSGVDWRRRRPSSSAVSLSDSARYVIVALGHTSQGGGSPAPPNFGFSMYASAYSL